MPSDEPIQVRVGEALSEADATLAVAESATGGLVCSMLTDVPGASEYLDRGFVTYAYEAKTGTLGVDRELLDVHGAVSEPVAEAMAAAARDLAATRWAVSVTGTAGPDGGTDEKPVGTTYIGVAHAGPWGSGETWVRARHYEFEGSRKEIKQQAARQSLKDLLASIEDQ